jgi:hypothetical protein
MHEKYFAINLPFPMIGDPPPLRRAARDLVITPLGGMFSLFSSSHFEKYEVPFAGKFVAVELITESLMGADFFVLVTAFLGFVDVDVDDVAAVRTRRGRLDDMLLDDRNCRWGAEGLIGDILRCLRIVGWGCRVLS